MNAESSKSAPLISVVIPTRHRNDLLARCLDGLAPGIQRGAPGYEVIVTDDGVDADAQRMVTDRYPWSRWIVGPKRGPAANRNSGARAAYGEWLVFLDDDCIPDACYVISYANAICDQPGFDVFEGRTYADRPRKSLAETSPINENGGFLWSCNFLIRKSLFESMHGFDERFPYAAMEDVEFRVRLKKIGQSFWFVKKAAVCHPWRIAFGPQRLTQYEQSLRIYLNLHQEQAGSFTPWAILMGNARQLIRTTIPGLWRFKAAGFPEALREHLFAYGIAWRFWRKGPFHNRKH